MPYEQSSNKTIPYPRDQVFQAAKAIVPSMGGKILKEDEEKGILHAQMDKKLFGNYLGDRSKLEMQFTEEGKDSTNISIFAYPLDAVGQKLMFGARKGVVETIIKTFYEELEKHLKKNFPSE